MCPDPNVKLEKETLLAKHLCCQAKIKCWWVFMDIVIFKKAYISLICL